MVPSLLVERKPPKAGTRERPHLGGGGGRRRRREKIKHYHEESSTA